MEDSKPWYEVFRPTVAEHRVAAESCDRHRIALIAAEHAHQAGCGAVEGHMAGGRRRPPLSAVPTSRQPGRDRGQAQ